MAPRTSWKGFLKLSLISIPVKAFTANNTEEAVRLNQLHKGCHQRVKYKKVCPEHGELKATEIVSGYEFAKDEYVVIDPGEISKLRPESDHAVKIHGFVPAAAIDPIYQAGKTYYLLPDGVAGDKAYALLRKGLVDQDVVAIAAIVIAGREQLVMIRPLEDLIAISVLHVAACVKEAKPFEDELGDLEVTKEEVALTTTLIQASMLHEFDYSAYKDEYVHRLRELIRLKIDGQEIVQAPDVEEPKILNLMDALKRSVAEAQAASASAGGEKRMAPSKGADAEPKAKRTSKKKMAPSEKKSEKSPARRRKSG